MNATVKAPAAASAPAPAEAAAAGAGAAAGPPIPISAPAAVSRFARLRRQLEGLLNSGLLRKLRVGLTVRDAASGEEIISHNASAPFNPASNTKIFTTAAALATLGADFRYQTVLLAPALAHAATPTAPSPAALALAEVEDTVIAGDVFVQGSGDPALTPAGLVQLASELARRGVQRIEGDVRLDGQFRDLLALQQNPSAPTYGAEALILNRNAYAVRVEPGRVGQSASAWVDGRSPFFVLHNQVRTVRGKKVRLFVDHVLRGDRLSVTVRGRIGSQHRRASVRRRFAFAFAASWATAILSRALTDAGITVRGAVRIGPPPPGPLRVVARHLSEPLAEICRVVNKDSNNYVADVIWKTLGAERFGLPGTLEKGARAVDEWLSPLGLVPARVHLVNGSGLTYENRVRPADLGQLLYKLYQSLDLGPVFMQTLAVGGVDGTIHYRFRGPATGMVRGKTGTLNGVAVLSGYAGAQPGVLIFTIFTEGFRPRRIEAVRQAQNGLVEEMLRYLRETSPKLGPPLDKLPELRLGDDPPPDEQESEEGEAG